MTISLPYEWLPRLDSSVDKEEKPLFGQPPDFPWEQLSSVLTKVFQLKSLVLTPSTWSERKEKEFYTGLGTKHTTLLVDFSPLKGLLAFAMEDSELDRLVNLLLIGNAQAATVIDEEYHRACYQFIALEVFNIFSKLDYDKEINPHLILEGQFPTANCLTQDISIKVNAENFMIRILVSEELRHSWQERYAERTVMAKFSKEASSRIPVVVHVEAGRTLLKVDEWEQISLGDCLLLDECLLEPTFDKGRVILSLNGHPLFRAKVKDGNIKILESPFFQDINTQISSTQQQEAPLDDTFDEEFTDFDEEFTENDAHATEIAEGKSKPEAKAPSAAAKPAQASAQTTVKEAPASQKKPQAAQKTDAKKPVSVSGVSLTIVVEVGRVQMPLDKFLELQPGGLLELDIHPERGVDLVINGSVVAKGELLKIGDSLGVRILDKA